jgi:hypothetical protein
MRVIRSISVVAAMAALAFGGRPVEAQSLLLPPTPEKGVWIEAAHADFKGFKAAFPTTVWYVSGRLPLTQRLRVSSRCAVSRTRSWTQNTGEPDEQRVRQPVHRW